MGEGQTRRIAAFLLLCVPAARGLGKAATADHPGGKWQEEQHGAAVALARRAWQVGYPGGKWQEKGNGQETDLQKEMADSGRNVQSAHVMWPGFPPYDDSIQKFRESEQFKKYRPIYESAGDKKEEDDAQLDPRIVPIRVAAYMYSGPFYTKMNAALRFPNCAASAQPARCKADKEEVYDLTRTVMSAWAVPTSLPMLAMNTPETRFLYRGSKDLMPILAKTGPDGVPNYKTPGWKDPVTGVWNRGFIFQDEGFMSATTDPAVARMGWSLPNISRADINWVLKIDCQHETWSQVVIGNGCYLLGRDVHKSSKYPGEKEVFFLPGTAFRVLYYDEGNPTYITITPLPVGAGYNGPEEHHAQAN
mmetsp:Transcript_72770/g.168678  ORF Transcript_72770/g.168678 Transcript_72770/m.168678 type:complete len:362 (-) Transcript_72770:32-1117(-)